MLVFVSIMSIMMMMKWIQCLRLKVEMKSINNCLARKCRLLFWNLTFILLNLLETLLYEYFIKNLSFSWWTFNLFFVIHIWALQNQKTPFLIIFWSVKNNTDRQKRFLIFLLRKFAMHYNKIYNASLSHFFFCFL